MLPATSPAPWLVYVHVDDNSKKFQTFCTISSGPTVNSKYCHKSIPALRGKFIEGSSDGWLVLRDFGDNKIFSLWNLDDEQAIDLPPLEALEDAPTSTFILLCPPHEGDDNCGDNLLLLLFADEVAFSCWPKRENCTWVTRNTEMLSGERACVTDAITCNGMVYGYADVASSNDGGGVTYNFVTIEVNDYEKGLDRPITLRRLEADLPDSTFDYRGVYKHLLESCGRIYNVSAHSRQGDDNHICAVNVWELSSDLTKWLRVKNLGDRAFFVGGDSNTWCSCSNAQDEHASIQGNCVYFFVPEGFGTTNALYIYNLEDCSLTSLLPCPKLPSPWYGPTWFMPKYQSICAKEVNKHNIEEVGIKKIQQSNEVQVKFPICDLPVDMITSVAQHLHLFDYVNFRATCKKLRSAAPPARWRTNNSHPLFMFFESNERSCRLMDPCRSDSRDISIPESFGDEVFIDFSKDGWLLLCKKGGDSLCFFNPFIGDKGKYPSCMSVRVLSTVGFSTCPTSSDCITVGIINTNDPVIIICHRFGDEMWERWFFEEDREFMPGITTPVWYKEAFYFLDTRGYVGEFKFIKEEGNWEVYGKPQTPSTSFLSSHLVECDGELLSVFIGHMGSWVRVFKFDWSKKKWARVKSLGNHSLFIGLYSSHSIIETKPVLGNRIYLPRRLGNAVVFYDLEKGGYGTHMSEDLMPNFSGTTEYARCGWI